MTNTLPCILHFSYYFQLLCIYITLFSVIYCITQLPVYFLSYLKILYTCFLYNLYCLLLHNYPILDKTVSIFHKCSFLVVAIWICYSIKDTHTPGLWWDCSTQDTPHTGESEGVGSGSAYTCHTCNPQILGDMNMSHWHGTAWTLIPLGHSYRLQFTKYIHILRHFRFVTGLCLTCFPYPHTFFYVAG